MEKTPNIERFLGEQPKPGDIILERRPSRKEIEDALEADESRAMERLRQTMGKHKEQTDKLKSKDLNLNPEELEIITNDLRENRVLIGNTSEIIKKAQAAKS